MSEELDDIKEFTEMVEKCEQEVNNNWPKARQLLVDSAPSKAVDKSDSINPGQVTQYALYGSGYTATTPTIDTLPPGCYDINADSRCVYATPVLQPSGLLLDLPEMKSNDVINVVESFWNSEKDYKEGNEFVIGGAAFKAGLLIFGPPGSGKSTTIKLVSNRLVSRGGIVFYSSSSPITVASFLVDFARVENNRKCIVILEDIDSLISRYGESDYLEMLDSAKTINNVMFIATTNYPERLDPRIYSRPGRFSHVIKIGLPTSKMREAYLKAILKNHRDVDEIVSKTQGFTIDHLTAIINSIYRQKKDLNKEIERVRLMFKMPKSEEKTMGIKAHGWEE